MAIDGINGINGAEEIRRRDWRNAPLSEIQENMEEVKIDNPEVADWAIAMGSVLNASDTVTYQMTGGSVENFTAELDQITNDNIALNELPASGQAATPEAVQNPPEAEPEEENPEVGPEDRVQPDVATIAPPETEEVPEEEKPDEIKPEEEVEEQQKEEALNPDANLTDLDIENRKRKRGELQ